VRTIIIIFFISIIKSASAQTVVLDEDFNAGIPAGWQVIDMDMNIVDSQVSSFTAAWITDADPDTLTGDLTAQSTSFYSPADTSSDYLITPRITLGTYGNYLYWDARSQDPSFPDDYIVLASQTDSLPGSFTDTLRVVTSETPYWRRDTISLDSAGLTGKSIFLAFVNNSADRYILHIDNILAIANDPVTVTESQELKLNVYPNPCTRFFRVTTTETLSLKLMDATGRRVNEFYSNTDVSVENLAPGMYHIESSAEGFQFYTRLIISR
jgi:hypothetical protein